MKFYKISLNFWILIISCILNEAVASETDSNLIKIDSLNYLCSRYWMVDQSRSIKFGEQALHLATSIDNKEEISVSLRNIGSAYLYIGEHHTALAFYYKALKIARTENLKYGIKSCLSNIGYVYFRLGDYQNAIFYHTESLKLKKELNDNPGTANSLNHLGQVHQKLKDYDTALEYYNNALKILNSYNNERLLGGLYNNIGSLYLDKADHEQAILNFKRSISLCEKYHQKRGLADAYKGLGIVFEALGDIDKAKSHFYWSLELSQQMKNKKNISENYFHLARLAWIEKEYNHALDQLGLSHSKAMDMSAKDKIMENYNLYARIYSSLNDYNNAYLYLTKANILKESLSNEKLRRSLANMKLAEEESRNRQAIILKDLEISQTKAKSTFLTIILLMSVTVIILIFLMYRIKEIQGKALKLKNFQISRQKREIELQKEILQSNNTKLEKAQNVISDQNTRLSKMNKNLDKLVKAKTEELSQTNKELEKALTELDTFIYKSSHDIKGPLARLLGLCNVALMDVKHKKAREYFNMLNVTANYLNSTLTRLLTIIEIKNIDRNNELIDFNNITQQILMENSFHDGFSDIKFEINIDPKTIFYSDPELIKIILHNLLENSIKYHKTKEETDPFVGLFINFCNKKLQINIIDNGIGIRKNELQLFEMFSKASNRYQSAGLGLYMVKVCVDKLSGTINLVENPSNFTEFLVELPIQLQQKPATEHLVLR
ncbi:hypothetical protein BH23BAC1_BH23BAC1_10020 [soil metagenome]